MRKRNGVKQLNKTASHRKAMFSNMATSLLEHEKIVTTKPKAKELRVIVDKLITRAKKNLTLEDEAAKLHNKREVMRFIHDRDVVAKLFDDIAVRNKDRNGGYTRMYLMETRSDSSEMVQIELVEKKN